MIIKAKRASSMLPVLETILTAFGRHASQKEEKGLVLKKHAAQNG